MRSYKVRWTDDEGRRITSACSYSERAAQTRVRLLEEAKASAIETFEVHPMTGVPLDNSA
ncbi:hypothetical protein [Streptomyces scabiei]|uniref:hypothetical protein n=1 Tax=Streptomyces scabiei TaxID=1930 RepID=UPI0029B68EFA|nr:hypothetical protein [Streptomyces scabiei]MDX3206031.1 hypothetical protein [Streptomyces scabiei]